MHMKELENAVQYLYGKGVIKKDKDIADKTGYNKATISSYITGRTKPSDYFLRIFEKSYSLKLSNFKGNINQSIDDDDDHQSLIKDGSIEDKINYLNAMTKVNQSLLIEILASQSGKTYMEIQGIINTSLENELKK